MKYPLASDITKEVARSYGVLIEDKGIALRGLFVIDPEGILRYAVVHDLNVGRSAEETIRVIQALQRPLPGRVASGPGDVESLKAVNRKS